MVEQIDAVVRRNLIVILARPNVLRTRRFWRRFESHALVAEIHRIIFLDRRVSVDVAMVAFTVRVQAAILAVRALVLASVPNVLNVWVHEVLSLAIILAELCFGVTAKRRVMVSKQKLLALALLNLGRIGAGVGAFIHRALLRQHTSGHAAVLAAIGPVVGAVQIRQMTELFAHFEVLGDCCRKIE